MNKKNNDLIGFFFFVGILLTVIYLGQNLSWYIDLTEDKRFTLTESTIELLESVEDPVSIEIYLEGDLNPEFRTLRNRIEEILNQFDQVQGLDLDIRFFDPNNILHPKERADFLNSIASKGIPATTLFEIVDGQRKERVIFPGAVIKYRDKEQAVLLLKGNRARSSEEQLAQSIEGLEYEFASAIYQLVDPNKKRIAYIQGHGTINARQTLSLDQTLSGSFEISQVPLDSTIFQFDALIIARPKQPFEEKEQFFLDQYLVMGGSLLMLLDPIQMNLDSIPIGGTYAFARAETGLEDILFRIGARVNHNLVQDLQAGRIQVVTGQRGDKNNIQLLPWPYFVYLNTFSDHPIVRNLDVIQGKFVSTIDTLNRSKIKKTPLVYTSNYTRIKDIPSRVSLNEIREIQENRNTFNRQNVPVAWLLEGSYPTAYHIKFPPSNIDRSLIKTSGKPFKIVVMGDGDLIVNEFDRRTKEPLSIEFDPTTGQPLSNLDFIQNALFYLTDAEGVITARKKTITQRPLDRIRAREEAVYWQLFNIGLPILFLALFGFLFNFMRKKSI
jgi:gliding-associated putative ABC transporter substrate-binding component GldG